MGLQWWQQQDDSNKYNNNEGQQNAMEAAAEGTPVVGIAVCGNILLTALQILPLPIPNMFL